MKIIKTAKIELQFLCDQQENLIKLRKVFSDGRILANRVNSLYQVDFNRQWQENLADETKPKFYYKHNKNLGYEFSKYEKENITSVFRAGITSNVETKFKNDWKDVFNGKKTFATYKSDLPIFFLCQSTVKAKSFLEPYKKDYKLDIGGFSFVTFLGKDKSNNRSILEKLKKLEYKFCDSSLSYQKNKIFINLVYSFESDDKIILSKDNILGVDMGIQVPLACAINNSDDRLFVGTNDIIQKRYSFRKQRKNLSIMLADSTVTGHGRKRKMGKLDALGHKERNYVNTLFHNYASQVIKFAVKNNCGIIKLEDLSGIGKTNKSIVNSWGYYSLQQKIIDKSKVHNIEVIMIDPRYTSRTCSKCGHQDKENRLEQSKFLCTVCSYEENADYNAAKNISLK